MKRAGGSYLYVHIARRWARTLALRISLTLMSVQLMLIVFASPLVSWVRKRRLVSEGTPAIGTVVAHREVRGKSPRYLITFSFKISDGTEMRKEVSVGRGAYNRAYVGSPLTVLYDPAKPWRAIAYEYCDFEVLPMVG